MSSQLIFNFCACLLAVQAGLTVKDINSPNVDQQQNIEVDDGFLGFGIGSAANTVTFNSFNNVGGVGDSFNSGFNGAGNLRRRGSGISAVNSPLINQQQDITANEGLGGGALNTITFNSFNNVAGVSSGRFNRRGSGIDAVNSPIINQQQDIQAGNGLFDGALNTITFNSFDNVAEEVLNQ
ncbi:hypothetical protein CONCODRAFT_73893 [Conidiobolus coronatus NRRL 28638]|uniref:Uncharacterized protein n=1 Tax=Conidiobolus coronatus (strain ATCC 28846 / CBS 209.66 / NRRL 28638) TaxID=796925 RepID=A0A137NTT0_CONC2|nr:hypothetical protein CONCODRAFT_73893 [Conidiobolus coronatus NRRL 28638]|eukprot:KXN66108.1 hypothetical protein CONCODRAFT_73893 [Conidiobolus coronatus NRRL 28638]